MDTPKVLRNCDVCNDLVCNDCLEKYRDAWGRKRKACEDCHEKDTRKEELAKISLGIIVLAGLAIFAYSTFGDQFSTSETPETQIVITASGSWEGRLMVDDDMRDISGSGSKTYTEQGDYISVFVVNGDSEIDSNFQWSTSEICVELVQNGEVIDSDCSSELLGTVEVETGSYIPFAGTLSTISMIALAAGWLARGKNRVA
jgi:hypothetical protein